MSKASQQDDQSSERQTDAQLIERICAGERELFQTLIEPHQRTVFSVVYSLLNNAADAEEVAQEAFIKAFRSLAGFRAEAKFSTWLIQIAINAACKRFRSTHLASSPADSESFPAEPVLQ